MDHKRQEIHDCQQTLQQLKNKVHSVRKEKVMFDCVIDGHSVVTFLEHAAAATEPTPEEGEPDQ